MFHDYINVLIKMKIEWYFYVCSVKIVMKHSYWIEIELFIFLQWKAIFCVAILTYHLHYYYFFLLSLIFCSSSVFPFFLSFLCLLLCRPYHRVYLYIAFCFSSLFMESWIVYCLCVIRVYLTSKDFLALFNSIRKF